MSPPTDDWLKMGSGPVAWRPDDESTQHLSERFAAARLPAPLPLLDSDDPAVIQAELERRGIR